MINFPFEKRVFDNYQISEDVKSELRTIREFWKGKTLSERIENQLNFDEKKGSNHGVGNL